MARTLSDAEVASYAAAHETARRTAEPIDPPSREYPGMTLDDAYAIQAAWVDLQVSAGAEVRGHKVGLTSRAMQQAMRISDYTGFMYLGELMEFGPTDKIFNHADNPKTRQYISGDFG